jgi:3'-phosphoadenosine 5'-phosphosulfate sulfotransferase (PAPS reductase)/FAD synthetase
MEGCQLQKTANVLSISGGKDSTAMWIYAKFELGVEVIPVFADTGHEHTETYRYLDHLENLLGPIRRVKADFAKRIEGKRKYIADHWYEDLIKGIRGQWTWDELSDEFPEDAPPEPPDDYLQEIRSGGWVWKPPIPGMDPNDARETVRMALEYLHPTGNPFLDLCLWKGRFPSTKARFCTQFLKIIPITEYVYLPLLEEGYRIVSWQGVRKQESPARAKLDEREETPEGYEVYRPILEWTADDVFSMHDKHGIAPNPLYKQGMGRVGCMPCINCNKDELFEIARRFPDEIQRVAAWEQLVKKVSKRGAATFFPTAHGQGNGIDEWVEWSKTSFGGKQYDMMKVMKFIEPITCSSVYGLCE